MWQELLASQHVMVPDSNKCILMCHRDPGRDREHNQQAISWVTDGRCHVQSSVAWRCRAAGP